MNGSDRHDQHWSTNGTDAQNPWIGAFPVTGIRPTHGTGHQYLLSNPLSQRVQAGSNVDVPSHPLGDVDGSVSSFLARMPAGPDDPTRYGMWTELIRLKTRTLELEIADARRKEKEAEVELARLRAVTVHRVNQSSGPMTAVDNGFLGQAGPPTSTATNAFPGYEDFPLDTQAGPPIQAEPSAGVPISAVPSHLSGPTYDRPQTPMTPFDLEAMMQDSNMDSLFAWLPDFGEPIQPDTQPPTAINPLDLLASMPNPSPIDTKAPYNHPALTAPEHKPQRSPLIVKRQPSSSRSSSSSPPPAKRTKRGGEKKTIEEHSSTCITCSKPLARILIRAPKSQIPANISAEFRCRTCKPVDCPAVVPDPATTGTTIGTVEMRKRMRAQMELDDEEVEAGLRRAFCDVCQRLVGSGQVVGGREKEAMGQVAEVICTACDSKYQR